MLGLPQLDDQIRNARLAFIVGLLNGSIDCPVLLSSIQLYVPARTIRPRAMLAIPETKTAFASRDPFLRICLALNAASDAYEPGMTIANVLSCINLLAPLARIFSVLLLLCKACDYLCYIPTPYIYRVGLRGPSIILINTQIYKIYKSLYPEARRSCFHAHGRLTSGA